MTVHKAAKSSKYLFISVFSKLIAKVRKFGLSAKWKGLYCNLIRKQEISRARAPLHY